MFKSLTRVVVMAIVLSIPAYAEVTLPAIL